MTTTKILLNITDFGLKRRSILIDGDECFEMAIEDADDIIDRVGFIVIRPIALVDLDDEAS